MGTRNNGKVNNRLLGKSYRQVSLVQTRLLWNGSENESEHRYNGRSHVYNFVSQMDNIVKMHEHLSELWLVFLNRKSRFASK